MDAANEILKENNDQFEEILKLSLGKNESLACTIRSNVYKSFSRVSPTKVPAE